MGEDSEGIPSKVSGDAEATGTTPVNHRSLVPFSNHTQAEESPRPGHSRDS